MSLSTACPFDSSENSGEVPEALWVVIAACMFWPVASRLVDALHPSTLGFFAFFVGGGLLALGSRGTLRAGTSVMLVFVLGLQLYGASVQATQLDARVYGAEAGEMLGEARLRAFGDGVKDAIRGVLGIPSRR